MPCRRASPVTGSGLSLGAIAKEAWFGVRPRFGSQSQASRFPLARRRGWHGRGWCRAAGRRWTSWPDGPSRSSRRADPRGDRVDERCPLRARPARAGWQVEIADAQKVKGLAPLACKTDRIDAWVLAELCRRDLVPAIWLPDPQVRAERERARWRLHLVRHRSSLKQRVHAVLLSHGKPCPVSDLRRARPPAARRARAARALAGNDRGQPASDRRAQ